MDDQDFPPGFPAPSPFFEFDTMCHTEECENAGHVIRVLASRGPDGEPSIQCGPCGEPLDDVVEVTE